MGTLGMAVDLDPLTFSPAPSMRSAPEPFGATSNKLAERMVYLDTLTWTSAMATETVVGAYMFPSALLTNAHIIASMANYQFYRAKVKISIRMSSTAFNYGSLLVAWMPLINPTTGTPYVGIESAHFRNNAAMSNGDCHVLSANSRETFSFEIPWRWPKEWLDVTGNNPAAIGSVVIRVLTPLRTPDAAAATAKLVVHAQFVDLELSGPSTTNISINSSPPNIGPSVYSQGERAEANAMRRFGVSQLFERVRRVAFDIARVPVPSVATTAASIGAVSAVLRDTFQSAGMSKPLDTVREAVVIAGKNLCNGDGNFLGQRLTLASEATVGESEAIVGPTGALSVARWCEQPALISVGTLSTASPGDLVMQFPVSPTYCKETIYASTKVRWEVPFYTWLTLPHTYWRGSMRYRLMLFSSPFITTRLQIVWLPRTPSPIIGPDFLAGNLLSRIVEVTGDTVVDLEVPYLQAQAWSVVGRPHGPSSTVNQDYLNGRIGVYVLAPNVGATTAATSAAIIDFALFASPGPDFQVSNMANIDTSITVVPQGLQDWGKGFESLAPSTPYVDNGRGNSDVTSSVLQMLHRPTFYGVVSGSTASWGTITFGNSTGVLVDDPAGTTTIPNTMTMFQWLTFPWLAMRGGIRYHIMGAESAATFWVVKVPTGKTIAVTAETTLRAHHYFGASGTVIGNNGGTSGPYVEVEVPTDGVDVAWRPSGVGQAGLVVPSRRVYVFANNASFAFRVLVSAADNFILGTPTSPPSLYSNTI